MTVKPGMLLSVVAGLFFFVPDTKAKPTRMLDFKVGMEWTYLEEYRCGGPNCQERPRHTTKEIHLMEVKSGPDTTELLFKVRDSVFYPNSSTSVPPLRDTIYQGICKASGNSISCVSGSGLPRIFPFSAVDETEFINFKGDLASSRNYREERLLPWTDSVYFLDEFRMNWRIINSSRLYFLQGVGTVYHQTHWTGGYESTDYSYKLLKFNGKEFDHEKFLLNFIDAYRQVVGVRPSAYRARRLTSPTLHLRGTAPWIEQGKDMFLLNGRAINPTWRMPNR